MYLVRHIPTERTATVATAGEVHELLTGWLVDAGPDVGLKVDELGELVEQGRLRTGRAALLQVQLDLEVDEVP